MSAILTRSFPAPPTDEREILRYAGCREADPATLLLLRSVLDEASGQTFRVCYRVLPLRTEGNVCVADPLRIPSASLTSALSGCPSVLIFAATVGVEIDRMIARYGKAAPARALMAQAIGAERIEALCDLFCQTFARERGVTLTPRFSPGYGDLPLGVQKDLFALLDCPRRIGLTLNDSLLMSPSKSVTAFVGIRERQES